MKQKEIFLQSEGDAWFTRNQQTLATRKLPDDDPLLREILDIHDSTSRGGARCLKLGVVKASALPGLKTI